MTTVHELAFELVRTALIAKLAVDLNDGELSRRAATEAAGHARLLAGLLLPAPEDDERTPHAAVVQPGSTLEELLRLAYPSASHLDDLGEPDDDQADDHDGGAAA